MALQRRSLTLSLSLSLAGKQNSTESVITQNSQSFANSSSNSAKNSQISSKFKPYALCALATLCIHWGIASYQPFIDTALILLCGGVIVILIDEKCSLKTALYKSRFLIISVGLAAISYKIVLDIFKKIGISEDTYNNQMIALADLPKHFVLAVKLAFTNLFAYNEPFMPAVIAYLFGGLVVILLILLFTSKLKFSAKFAILLLFVGAIIASQTHIILAKTLSANIITNFYGLLFLRVLVVILAFKLCIQLIRTQILAQNALFALLAVVIWQCVVQDLQAQKVQKLTMDRDFAYLNRIIARIETNENFSYDKKYYGIMFGAPQNRYTQGFNTDLFPTWYMAPPFRWTMSKNAFTGPFLNDVHKKHPDNKDFNLFKTLIKRLDKAGILDELQPFPHKNSVVVFEDIIVFVASKGNLDEIRAEAKKWRENEGVAQ